MAKQRIEKPIKISGEFPIDLWSVSIDLISLNIIGPVLVMKKGSPMHDGDSYMLYTVRTKKEMIKSGYSVTIVTGKHSRRSRNRTNRMAA